MAIDFQKSSKSGISFLDYMIAHYKCNEESGAKVFNHSGLALAGGGRLPYLNVTDSFQDLLSNGSMEEWDDPNTPTGWLIDTGVDGFINQEDTDIFDGLYACKMTSTELSIPTIAQDILVEEEDNFILNFMTHGDGIKDGYYGFYDVIGATWIIPLTSTGKPGTEYEKVSIEIPNLPTGTYLLYLTGPLGEGICYFDKIAFNIKNTSVFWDTKKGFCYSPFSSNFKLPEGSYFPYFNLIKCYTSKIESDPHFGKGYFGLFIKRIENWGLGYINVLIDFGNVAFYLNIHHSSIGEYTFYGSDNFNLDEWYFIFFSGKKFYIINQNGELYFESEEYESLPIEIYTAIMAIGLDVTGYTHAGFQITSGCIFGDIIIISSHKFENPINFTLTQWGKKYDEFRSRYNMSARDGW